MHSAAGLQELAEIFALYLINYKDVQISVYGNIIDPSGIITNKEDVALTPIHADDHEHAAQLEIIEWGRETKRALYLCNAEGFPLSQVDTRFHVGQFYPHLNRHSPYPGS